MALNAAEASAPATISASVIFHTAGVIWQATARFQIKS